jgi:hypothetical protein
LKFIHLLLNRIPTHPKSDLKSQMKTHVAEKSNTLVEWTLRIDPECPALDQKKQHEQVNGAPPPKSDLKSKMKAHVAEKSNTLVQWTLRIDPECPTLVGITI